MKYVTTMVFMMICALSARAQNNVTQQTINTYTRANKIPTIHSRDVEGSPYYKEKWQTGYVLLNSGKKSKNAYLRYDTYHNQVLFKKKGKVLAVIPGRMKGFVLLQGSQKIVFKKGFESPENDISPDLLLQIIYSGKTKLVEKYHTYLHKSNGPNPLTGENTDEFINKEHYYLVTSNGKFHEVDLKRKDILKHLNLHKSELKAYAKSKNLDFGDEQDLQKILREYDKMLKSDEK